MLYEDVQRKSEVSIEYIFLTDHDLTILGEPEHVHDHDHVHDHEHDLT